MGGLGQIYDPVAQMDLEAKRDLVEHDKAKAKVRDELERVMRERVPKGYRKGKVLPLVFYPDERLTQGCAEVEAFDKELAELARDMTLTMYLCGGVGLAAPQVGQLKRLVVCDWSEKRDTPTVMVNPEVVAASEQSVRLEEACLSIPGGKVHVYRPEHVTVRYQDIKGKSRDEALTGWPARIAQHEIDHLDGQLMLDKVSRLERRFALRTLGRIKKREAAPKKKRGKRRRR